MGTRNSQRNVVVEYASSTSVVRAVEANTAGAMKIGMLVAGTSTDTAVAYRVYVDPGNGTYYQVGSGTINFATSVPLVMAPHASPVVFGNATSAEPMAGPQRTKLEITAGGTVITNLVMAIWLAD